MWRRIGVLLLLTGVAFGCNKPADYGVVGGPDKGNAHEDGGASDAQTDDPSCVKRHPRAASDIEPGLLSRTIDDCEADDGACQASVECMGSVEDRICDADRFIGSDAAICIASAAGLAPGLQGLSAGFTYNYGYRRVIWAVRNVMFDEGANGSSGGAFMVVDAVSGEVLDTLGWRATP